MEKPFEQPSANQELIQAVRKAFPDPTGLPTELKDILDKTESSEMKKITADLHKSTAALGRARRQLQELQEAKSQHRAKWVQHLKRIAGRMATANRRIRQAANSVQPPDSAGYRRTSGCQKFPSNSSMRKAAQDRNLDTLLEETPAEPSDTTTVDAEETKLRERMKDVLAKAVKTALPSASDVVEVVDSPKQAPKRARSQSQPPGETKEEKDTAMLGGATWQPAAL